MLVWSSGTNYVTGNWGNTGRLTLRELHVHVTTGYTEDSPLKVSDYSRIIHIFAERYARPLPGAACRERSVGPPATVIRWTAETAEQASRCGVEPDLLLAPSAGRGTSLPSNPSSAI